MSLVRSRRLLPCVPDGPRSRPLQLEVSDRLTVSQVNVEVAYQTVRTGLDLWMAWRMQARARGVQAMHGMVPAAEAWVRPWGIGLPKETVQVRDGRGSARHVARLWRGVAKGANRWAALGSHQRKPGC